MVSKLIRLSGQEAIKVLERLRLFKLVNYRLRKINRVLFFNEFYEKHYRLQHGDEKG